jgi:hypothetical protein
VKASGAEVPGARVKGDPDANAKADSTPSVTSRDVAAGSTRNAEPPSFRIVAASDIVCPARTVSGDVEPGT